eukprot:2182679-Alexandrium_andersonii.AAC.1
MGGGGRHDGGRTTGLRPAITPGLVLLSPVHPAMEWEREQDSGRPTDHCSIILPGQGIGH